ncbi:hypothetical protein BGX31_011006 [Mortierella sp. GBA43]|nr:hypothetical protein BGX31_011006 [Mortierella sp. GBA43]
MAVAPFLKNSDLAEAVLVCKSWNVSFTPFLYSTIEWSSSTWQRPTKEGVLRNGDHIRDLEILNDPLDTFSDNCTKLRSLKINTGKLQDMGLSRIRALVLENPGLRSIKIDDWKSVPRLGSILEALSSCPDLQTLRVDVRSLGPDCMDGIFKIAAVCLRRLILNGRDSTCGSLEKWPCFPLLKELGLSIDLPSHAQLEILRRCPELRLLSWGFSDRYRIPVEDVCEIFKTHCPLIETLELVVKYWSDEDALYIAGCPGFTSKMIHQIMTNCPNLTTLRATRLEACDILGTARYQRPIRGFARDQKTIIDKITDPQPPQQLPQDWICTNMEHLDIFIGGLQGTPREWHNRVFRQLAKLTKLRKLCVGPSEQLVDPQKVPESGGGLDLRLKAGLGALASLTQLRELKFHGLKQQLEEEDVRWMLNAWPKLRRVDGLMSYYRGVERNRHHLRLKYILNQANVQVVGYLEDIFESW